jgi:hypothetical protein
MLTSLKFAIDSFLGRHDSIVIERKCPICNADLIERRELFLRSVYRWLECDEDPKHFRLPSDMRGYNSDKSMQDAWNKHIEKGDDNGSTSTEHS